MKGRKRLPRLVVRLICFAAASVFLWPAPFWEKAPKYVLQFSPFHAICSSVALRAFGMSAGIIIAVIVIVRHRWFCRYACPLGLLLEGVERLGLRRKSWWTRCPPAGKYAALVTLAGAVLGYPLLLWMDPLAILSNSFSLRVAGNTPGGALAGLLLVIIISLSLTSGAIWCARLCPLGGTQELLASAGSFWMRQKPGRSSENSVSRVPFGFLARRAFILGATGTVMGFVARRIGAARGESAPLRPPGSVGEDRFAGLCIRCGNCVRACPPGIIHPDIGAAGFAGLLAPAIRYDRSYCLEDCRLCTQVCPSGAIQELELPMKRRSIIGEALVDGSLCLVALGRKDCDACARACPYEAVQIVWDQEQYVAYPLVDSEKCNGCGACEVVCPTLEIKAIRVWKRIDKSILS